MKRQLCDLNTLAPVPTKQAKRKNLPVRCMWTESEDARLAALAQIHGGKNWDTIAATLSCNGLSIKTARQCRERWHNHLNPIIKDQPWTKEESDRLTQLHQRFGNKWSLIASIMVGRTDNSIKNFFFCKLRKAARCLKYGVVSLELDKEETNVEEALYLLDYLYKYYISPEREKNLKKTINPQIKGRRNAGDKYVAELLQKESINIEKFEKYVKDLLAILTPDQVEFMHLHYPHLTNASLSETDNTFSHSHQKPSTPLLDLARTFCGY